MVYLEKRKSNGRIQNYLVHGYRDNSGKIKKKSKFLGYGNISKKKMNKSKGEFEIEIKKKNKSGDLNEKQIEKIEKLKQIYFNKVDNLKKEEFEQFEKSFFTELTYNSNAIEGNTLSLEETSLILNEEIVPKGKNLREIHEVQNHQKALNFLKSYKGNLSEDLILRLHKIILNNISERFAGKYRKTNVRIFGSSCKLPNYEKVPQLIRNLVYWYNKNKKDYHPFEMAILVSMKLVTIHPFIDGNGRVSRLIMNFLLSKFNYPWINIYNKQREDYLKAVRKANDERYKEILEFCIVCLEENLEGFGFFD
ncbi:MAG: Fic family protein [Nanoarchaeota archaeon]